MDQNRAGSEFFFRMAIDLGSLSEDATKDNWAGLYRYAGLRDCNTEREQILFIHIANKTVLKVDTYVTHQ